MEASEATNRDTMQEIPIREVHNSWTVYGLNDDGSEADPPLAELSRPQDWGHPRWFYHFFKFEWVVGGIKWINNCHTWTDLKFDEEHLYAELFANFIVKPMYPGRPAQKCGRDFLDMDDFWEDDWGPEPPIFYSDEELEYMEDNDPMRGPDKDYIPEEETVLHLDKLPRQTTEINFQNGQMVEITPIAKRYFSPDGKGMGQFRNWVLCDGRNGTPDTRPAPDAYPVYIMYSVSE